MLRRLDIGKRGLAAKAALVAVCIAVALIAAAMRFGSPAELEARAAARGWVPTSLETVVLRLDRNGARDGLIALRKRLATHPANAAAASRYATLALQHYADTGDARFLGYAEGALLHWENDRRPPVPVWLLRGRILQTQHRFRMAAEELDRLRATHGELLEATLLAADAWRRAGALDKAKARCASLALAGRADLAGYCAADVFLSMGDAEKALHAVGIAQRIAGGVPESVAQWILAVSAETAAAAGNVPLAESRYRKALAIPGAGIALHVAFADLLLRDERPRDVMDALAGLSNADAVLLRRVIAAKRLGLPEFEILRARLSESFAEARALGAGRLHLREKAIFELHVENDPAAALDLARQNWEIQKGPEDATILMEAAEAAGAPEASRTVIAWRRQFKRHAG